MDDVRKEVGDSYASALSASDPGIAALAKTVKLLTEEESLRRSFLIISSQSSSMLFSADWKRFF